MLSPLRGLIVHDTFQSESQPNWLRRDMSFDIMLQRFENGRSVTFPRSLVDEIFGSHVVHRDPYFIRVRYPDRSGADIWIGRGEAESNGIMFNHCGGEQFANAFFALLERTGTVRRPFALHRLSHLPNPPARAPHGPHAATPTVRRCGSVATAADSSFAA